MSTPDQVAKNLRVMFAVTKIHDLVRSLDEQELVALDSFIDAQAESSPYRTAAKQDTKTLIRVLMFTRSELEARMLQKGRLKELREQHEPELVGKFKAAIEEFLR